MPKEIAKLVPKKHLMSETEWRSLGVQQSQGWEHYMRHDPGKVCFPFSECVCLEGGRGGRQGPGTKHVVREIQVVSC